MTKFFATISVLCFSTFVSIAQPGALDLSFDPGTGAISDVRATAVQSDSKIVIAGFFTDFNGTPLNHLGRLNSIGSVDGSFNIGTGADAPVYAMLLQTDGKILIGGDFANYNGTAAAHLARINNDGSLDTSFHSTTGTNGGIRTIALQTDGKIIIGGDFTSYNGITRQRIARVNTNGSLDNSFNSANGFNGLVEVIRLQTDGKIVVGGSFTIYGGINGCLRFGRLNSNGTYDTGFNTLLGGTSSTVYGLAIQPDGKILLGGDFINYNASPMSHIARVNPNGSVDPGFFVGNGPNDGVSAIAVQSNGKILIGGVFTAYDGVQSNRIMQLNADGHPDTANFKIGTGAPDRVFCITIQPNGKIIIGGMFTNYNGTPRRRIARLNNCITQQPDSIYGNSYALCSGGIQTYSINPVADATQYEWTLPNGWLGNSASTSINITSSGMGGNISVRAFTDSCGWSYFTMRNIATIKPDSVPICLITVDSQSTHNILIWGKPQSPLIVSFIIYRETATNVYTPIASVPYDSLSEYHDYAANPNATSYRYKLSVLDTCGAESSLSDFHNTIHLQNLGGGNFQWTFYQIEGAANPVTSFNFYRDAFNNGSFFPIGNIPGTNATFTDVSAGSFPNAVYVVDANWNISCTPSRAVNTTRSNIRHQNAVDVSVQNINAENSFEIYPNPATERVYLLFNESVYTTKHIEIFNSIGQKVCSTFTENEMNPSIDVSSFAKGVYSIRVEANGLGVVKKLVIR